MNKSKVPHFYYPPYIRERERVFICQKHKIQYCHTILDNVGGLPKKQTLINAGRP